MGNEDVKLVLKDICPDGIWEMSHRTEKLLVRQINRLPKSSVSDLEIRYPTTPSGMRAFLDKFFARHYFQVQDSLVDYLVSKDIIPTFDSGHFNILDIGSGPALASLAIVDILINLLFYLKDKNTYELENYLTITCVLNDTSDICLGIGQQMLRRYFYAINKELPKLKLRIFVLEKPFPGNLIQLKRIACNLSLYDIVGLSYVIVPLNEDEGLDVIRDGVIQTCQISNNNSRFLILQDRFKESLIRRLARTLGVSCESSEITQKVYASDNCRDIQTYKYYRCLFEPPKKYLTVNI